MKEAIQGYAMIKRKSFLMQPVIEEEGFTLIEILVALTIFAIGALAVASMQVQAIQGNAKGNYVSEAVTAGTRHLETLMQLPYNHPDLTDVTNDDKLSTLDPNGRAIIDTPVDCTHTVDGFTLQWNIAEDDLIARTKTIWLDVTWTENSELRRISMQHVIPQII